MCLDLPTIGNVSDLCWSYSFGMFEKLFLSSTPAQHPCYATDTSTMQSADKETWVKCVMLCDNIYREIPLKSGSVSVDKLACLQPYLQGVVFWRPSIGPSPMFTWAPPTQLWAHPCLFQSATGYWYQWYGGGHQLIKELNDPDFYPDTKFPNGQLR